MMPASGKSAAFHRRMSEVKGLFLLAPEGKDAIRAATSTVGKGNLLLRDIPQSVNVITEKLIVDRNLDNVKEVLHSTAGVTFTAVEGGEEHIRLHGFSLASTGDIFLDGMRDAAFDDRDAFNFDRVELLCGSASMLFGRGSTGGAVNQLIKVPRMVNEKNATITAVGIHQYRRLAAELNQQTGEASAFRIAGTHTKADNNGAGSNIDKQGINAAYRFGIGEKYEFQASIYHLANNNGELRAAMDQAACCQHDHQRPRSKQLLRHGQRLQRRSSDHRHVEPYLAL